MLTGNKFPKMEIGTDLLETRDFLVVPEPFSDSKADFKSRSLFLEITLGRD